MEQTFDLFSQHRLFRGEVLFQASDILLCAFRILYRHLKNFSGIVLQGVKSGSEGNVDLTIDSIQFGAPSSAGSTDSDGVPALLESVSENKLPAPKEQRQKQQRAGPIKTQKVCLLRHSGCFCFPNVSAADGRLHFTWQLPEIEPVETKEHKPGPIGKERSLKNRKAKDARAGEGDGLEAGVPGGGVSRAADSTPPTSDSTVPELGGDIEGMITVPSAEYNSNSKVELPLHLAAPGPAWS